MISLPTKVNFTAFINSRTESRPFIGMFQAASGNCCIRPARISARVSRSCLGRASRMRFLVSNRRWRQNYWTACRANPTFGRMWPRASSIVMRFLRREQQRYATVENVTDTIRRCPRLSHRRRAVMLPITQRSAGDCSGRKCDRPYARSRLRHDSRSRNSKVSCGA